MDITAGMIVHKTASPPMKISEVDMLGVKAFRFDDDGVMHIERVKWREVSKFSSASSLENELHGFNVTSVVRTIQEARKMQVRALHGPDRIACSWLTKSRDMRKRMFTLDDLILVQPCINDIEGIWQRVGLSTWSPARVTAENGRDVKGITVAS